jgi:3-oxoisoapionate decarboxylase
MKRFKVGIDSYGLEFRRLTPFELLDWALMNDADGVQFSGIDPALGLKVDKPFLEELGAYASENNLYLEWGGGQHIPLDLASGKTRDIRVVNRKAAEEARILGVSVVRSCSGGLMRWNRDALPTDTYLRMSAESLKGQLSMLRDHGVTLALETHFEFTTFEILRLFDMCGVAPGEGLGICLDTMNLLTMLEDPIPATRRVLPWVVATHIKDGGILLQDEGLVSFPVPAGEGLVDFAAIFDLLATQTRRINLSLEDHGGDFPIPIFDPVFLSGFPDLTAGELASLLKLALRSAEAVRTGRMGILERKFWPQEGEARLKRGLLNIRRIANG